MLLPILRRGELTCIPISVQLLHQEYRADLCNFIAAVFEAVAPETRCELCPAEGSPLNAPLEIPGVPGPTCWMASQFTASLYGRIENCFNLQLEQPFCCGTPAPTVVPTPALVATITVATVATTSAAASVVTGTPATDGMTTEVTTQVILMVVIIRPCLYCPL